jgi:hypothetical protein
MTISFICDLQAFYFKEGCGAGVELVSLWQLAFLPRPGAANAQTVGVFYESGKGLIA